VHTSPDIKTTVVGSYTIRGWMDTPSQQELIKATKEVVTSLESAGLDLVCDVSSTDLTQRTRKPME